MQEVCLRGPLKLCCYLYQLTMSNLRYMYVFQFKRGKVKRNTFQMVFRSCGFDSSLIREWSNEIIGKYCILLVLNCSLALNTTIDIKSFFVDQ